MAIQDPRAGRVRTLQNPRSCAGCKRLLDAEDLRCVQCGTVRPPQGWTRLPEDGGGEDEPRGAAQVSMGSPAPLRIQLPSPGQGATVHQLSATLPNASDETEELDHLAPDRVFAGRYRIQERMGRRGHVQEFLAIQEPMVRRVVLSVLTPEGVGDEEGVAALERAFLEDAGVLASMRNPELARVFDCGRGADGTCFMTSEVAYGLSLREVLHWGPLPAPRLTVLAEELVRGMAELHKFGLIHRDLQVERVILEMGPAGRDRVRITGFAPGQPIVVPQNPEQHVSIAPELREGAEATKSSDVYALGALMYHALTGREASDPIEVVGTLTTSNSQLAPILLRCLEEDTSQRYPSALAVFDALEPLLPALGVAAAPAAAATAAAVAKAPPAPANTATWKVAAASAGMGAVVASLTWLVLNVTQEPPPPQVVEVEVPVMVPQPAPPVVAEVEPEEPAPEDLVEEPPPEVVAVAPIAKPPRQPKPQPKSQPKPQPKPQPVVTVPPPEPEVIEPEPPLVEAPVETTPAPVSEPEPEPEPESAPPPRYPKATALTGQWVGRAAGGDLVLSLKVDDQGAVSGSARDYRRDGLVQGPAAGQVVPNDDGSWTVELRVDAPDRTVTYSGRITGDAAKGRAYSGGKSLGRWSADR